MNIYTHIELNFSVLFLTIKQLVAYLITMKSYTDFILNTSVLKANARLIKKRIGNGVKFCAVVKANAYSHGLEVVCRSLYGIADFFAVANIKEASTIRLFDKVTDILILGKVDVDDLKFCYENNISVSIGSLAELECLVKSGVNAKVHLQVNTGLNRYGFRSIVEFKKALNIVEKNEVNLSGVYSHFATKGNDILFIKRQFYRFLQFKKVVKRCDVIFHIANSFATSHSQNYFCDMVRTGVLMYGQAENDFGIKPVLEIRSKIVNIMRVKRGDTIGYDRTFEVKQPMTIAVVPVGYADGFDRRLSNNFSVLVLGRWCKVVGLICMDAFMIDVTNLGVKVGDEVTLLGENCGKKLTLFDYSKALDISPYVVLLGFDYRRMNYIVKEK